MSARKRTDSQPSVHATSGGPMKVAFFARSVQIFVIGAFFTLVFFSGCALVPGSHNHDLSQPSAGFDASIDEDADLNQFVILLSNLEDARSDRTLALGVGAGIHKHNSTVPPPDLLTEAIRLHLKRRGFTVLSNSEQVGSMPFSIRINGKLWRCDLADAWDHFEMNIWTETRISTGNGKLVGKETTKTATSFAGGSSEHFRRSVRYAVDYAALQATLGILTTQSTVIADVIQHSTATGTDLSLNATQLKKYQQAIKDYMEELETMEMQIQVTSAAAKQAQEAQEQKINNLRSLQNSLDGIKATLPQ